MSEPVTIERLERALALCAYLMELYGPDVPLFERLERVLVSLRARENTAARAKSLLASFAATSSVPLLTGPLQPDRGFLRERP
jgi:hypothetical protein